MWHQASFIRVLWLAMLDVGGLEMEKKCPLSYVVQHAHLESVNGLLLQL